MICAFIVPTNYKGVIIGSPLKKLGHKASNTAIDILKNVAMLKENILAKAGRRFVLTMPTLKVIPLNKKK